MNNITPAQLALLGQLRAADPSIRVRWNETQGAAASIRGRLARLSSSTPHDFLQIYGQLFGLPDLGSIAEAPA